MGTKNKTTSENVILVISGQLAQKNSKVNWPDLNFPNSGLTILRTIHMIDYEMYSVQLDGANGPWFSFIDLPDGAGFYTKISNQKN